MKITAATFAACAVGSDGIPKDGKPVFAMIGRSNVGKSSMINTLVARRELAKTSSTPGKTLTLNYYLINEAFYLVDLPGFGFAKASKVTRDRVHQMVTDFFEIAGSLCGIIHVLDVRHPPSNLDLEMRRWIEEQRFRYLPILTKIDKLSQNELAHMVRAITKKIGVPAALLFSAKSSQGKEEILETLDFALQNPDVGPLLVRGSGSRPVKKRPGQEQGRGPRHDQRPGQGGGRPSPRPAPAPASPVAAVEGSPLADPIQSQSGAGTPGGVEPASAPAVPSAPGQPREGRHHGGQRQQRDRRPDHQRGQGGSRHQGPRPPRQPGQAPAPTAGAPGEPAPGGNPPAGQPGQRPQSGQGQGQGSRHRPHSRRRDGQSGHPRGKQGSGEGTPPSGTNQG